MINISFIGLGHMGHPMVRNLLKAGYRVKVYDVEKTAIESLVAQGALSSDSIAAAAEDADIIFTMLQTGQQVYDVCMNPKGIFSIAKKNILYIDSSSIEMKITRELHTAAIKHHIKMLDAPVSGGVLGAEQATLTIMVGGEKAHFHNAKIYLETLGRKVIYAGSAGLGQAAKICNNLILGISMIAVSEGFTLAEKLGLDPKKFFEISSNASGQCWSMTSYCPAPHVIENVPSNNDYQAGFMAKMMLKDLCLAENAADDFNVALPLGNKATEIYKLFTNEGYGNMDFSGIIKMIANKL
jgi:3-hydroxyisobutyrate dehydrogenase